MPPLDSTPRGDEMVRRQPERKFPETKPQGTHETEEMGHTPAGTDRHAPVDPDAVTDIASRPSIPVHPEIMAADVEDEDDDPVVDAGPGIADGAAGSRRDGS